MDWKSFFDDVQLLMTEANQTLTKFPLTSDDYWSWLFSRVGQVSEKYNNHPLVISMLNAVVKYQEDSLNQMIGRPND